MDIKIGNKPAGRIQMLLRSDVVPMTAGERGSGQTAKRLVAEQTGKEAA